MFCCQAVLKTPKRLNSEPPDFKLHHYVDGANPFKDRVSELAIQPGGSPAV